MHELLHCIWLYNSFSILALQGTVICRGFFFKYSVCYYSFITWKAHCDMKKKGAYASGELKTYWSSRSTVNPEYFVCMLFSFISYTATSVRKYNACERYKAGQRIRSGQRLYENFIRTKGVREPRIRKLSAYEIFWIYSVLQLVSLWPKCALRCTMTFLEWLFFKPSTSKVNGQQIGPNCRAYENKNYLEKKKKRSGIANTISPFLQTKVNAALHGTSFHFPALCDSDMYITPQPSPLLALFGSPVFQFVYLPGPPVRSQTKFPLESRL